MTFPTFTEVRDVELKLMVSEELYNKLFRMYIKSTTPTGWTFTRWIVEYLRGFAFGPGVEEADLSDHEHTD